MRTSSGARAPLRGPRHGRGKPQGGRNPGALDRRDKRGDPAASCPMRHGEETPGASDEYLSGYSEQSQEGMRRREAEAIRGEVGAEGETPRAQSVERDRPGRGRSKASRRWESARAQHNPREARAGGKWLPPAGVALKGQETSGERNLVWFYRGWHCGAGLGVQVFGPGLAVPGRVLG